MTATLTHARRRGFPCRRRAGGRHRFVALLVAFLAVIAGSLRAQDPRPLELPSPDTTRLYEITLRDGTTINGYIVDANGELQVRTLGGVELTLRRSDVVAVELSRGIIGGSVHRARVKTLKYAWCVRKFAQKFAHLLDRT